MASYFNNPLNSYRTNADQTKKTAKSTPPERDPPPAAAAPVVAVQEEIADAVSSLNDYVQNLRRDLHFTVDEDTGRTVIKVIDSETDEVIRQIPVEEALNLARYLEHNQAAMLQAQA
ncbi:MAG: flagellar protein FlaG [Gammaproteobacteria bacterium]|nr:MAG: flagellar protein FlaG [Gammaproteobacteria bacterium]